MGEPPAKRGAAPRILVVHGKGIDVRGTTVESQRVFGTLRMADYNEKIEEAARQLGCRVTIFYTNELDDCVTQLRAAESEGYAGVVINPGGFCKDEAEGPALAEALRSLGLPSIEVHYSNVTRKFTSLVAPGCDGVVLGVKHQSYRLGLQAVLAMSAEDWTAHDYSGPAE